MGKITYAMAAKYERESYAAYGASADSMVPSEVRLMDAIDAAHPEIREAVRAMYAEAGRDHRAHLASLPYVERVGPDGVCDLYTRDGIRID